MAGTGVFVGSVGGVVSAVEVCVAGAKLESAMLVGVGIGAFSASALLVDIAGTGSSDCAVRSGVLGGVTGKAVAVVERPL